MGSTDEEVLVISADTFRELGYFQGFSTDVRRYVEAFLASSCLRFLSRRLAEDDPNYKQLIPYIVLRHGNQIYCYERGAKGTETRLHRKLSLGIGGHVSKEDGIEGADAYKQGMLRELNEEVQLKTSYEETIVGVVHDDRTPVGEVHIGIVHLLDLNEPKVQYIDPALESGRFMTLEEIERERDRFESWSGFVIDHVLAAG